MSKLEHADELIALPRRRVAGVTLARAGLLGAWFAASLLVARVLGPRALGLYALCQAAIQVFTDCVADPLDAGVMREAPLLLRQNRREAALGLIRGAFWMRSAVGLLALAVTGAVPWLISRVIFDKPSYPHLAELTAAGILGDLLLRAALGYLQVSERFGRFLLVDGVWQLSRVLLVVALAASRRLSMDAAVAVYAGCPYVAFAVSLMLVPGDVRRFAAPAGAQLRQLLHFAKWLAIATVLGAVYERLDLFLLNDFHGPQQVGLYAGALTLAMVPDRFNGIVQTAITPRIAPAHAAGAFRHLQRQYLRFLLPGVAATAAALLFGGRLLTALLGSRFAGAVLPFQLLLLGTMFNLLVMPLPTALLNFVAPGRAMVVSGVGLLVVLVAGVLLIPRYGASGAAAVILLARVTVGIATLELVRRLTAAPTDGE